VRMIDRDHPLHDDRTLVDLLGDKMRSGTDNLHTAIECLLVGPRIRKRRQE